MPSAYVTEATVKARLGARATVLLDRDNDGSEDSGLLAAIIESKGRWIDMQLAQRYAVPFAQIGASPATPGPIEEIALLLVLADVYAYHEPDGRDAQANEDMAVSALEKLLEGDFDLDASRVKAHEGRHIVSATYEDPVISGTDSAGADRLRGV